MCKITPSLITNRQTDNAVHTVFAQSHHSMVEAVVASAFISEMQLGKMPCTARLNACQALGSAPRILDHASYWHTLHLSMTMAVIRSGGQMRLWFAGCLK
jgi:hypothetical protein